MTTVYDVARLAGVSTATVSRVMRGSDLVSPDTRDRVLAIVDRLDFVPDATAQGLTRRRKDIIGLVALDRGAEEMDVESTSRLFTDHIVHAAEAVARHAGSSLLLTFGRRDAQLERRVRVLSGKVDGMLIAEEIMPRPQLRALARRIPVVIIAGSRDETGIDVVLGDNTAGMTELARHLTGHHGYRRLGLVAGPSDAPDAVERRAAFEKVVLGTPGCVLDPVIEGDFSEESGIAAAARLLRGGPLPDAVACANDQMAIGVLREFRRAGVRVPQTTAVTGYDDIYPGRILDPTLTTVSQPLNDLGTRAARRLLQRVEDRDLAPRADVLPTALVTRASCGCPPPGLSPSQLHPQRGKSRMRHILPRPARRRRVIITAASAAATLVLAMLASAATAPAASATAVPAPPSGWSTVFSDDFGGAAGSGIDSQWEYNTGAGSTFGTGETETMTNSTSNVYEDGNGHLDITALDSGGAWTSGRVETTTPNVGAPAGGELEVTASIEQPSGGTGYWPAFWMLGPGQWPENGEIDIMEDVNSLSEVSGTVHCGTDPGGPCNESSGIGSGLQPCSGCQSGYHTYTMILNRTNTSDESITFYLDGNAYYTVDESTIGASTWQAAFDHNLSIIMDLAMGGAYPDGVCGCTSPDSTTASGGTMSVAYVAAYTTG